MKPGVIFAIDIETAGQSALTDSLIAIGSCTMLTDETLVSKETFPCFTGKNSESGFVWEEDTREFWSKHQSILDKFHVDTIKKNNNDESVRQKQAESLAIAEFRGAFRKAEDLASDEGVALHIVTDNEYFDIGFLNTKLALHGHRPLPYSAHTARQFQYPSWRIWNTDTMMFGMLLKDCGASVVSAYGLEKQMEEAYQISMPVNESPHEPSEDARTIALTFCKIYNMQE